MSTAQGILDSTSSVKGVKGTIVASIDVFFTSAVVAFINIVIAGRLLGYVFSLRGTGGDFMNIRIGRIFRLHVKNDQLYAGLASWLTAIFFVGAFLSNWATQIFTKNLQATDNHWKACVYAAASLSLVLCLVLTGLKYLIDTWGLAISQWRKQNRDIEEDLDTIKELTNQTTSSEQNSDGKEPEDAKES